MNNRSKVAVCVVISAIVVAVAWAQQRPIEIQGVVLNHIDADTYTETLPNGGLILGGSTRGSVAASNQGGEDAYAAFINSSGQRIWHLQFGSSADDSFGAFEAYPNGDVLLGGVTEGTLFNNVLPDSAPIAVRVSPSGSVLWTKSLPFKNTAGIEILECNSDGALLECNSGVGTSAKNSIIFIDNQGIVSWQTDITAWAAHGHEYIGRHGTHYRFAERWEDTANDCMSTRLRCISSGLQQDDTSNITNFAPEMVSCCIDQNAIIGHSRGTRASGEAQICLYNIKSGTKIKLLSHIDSDHSYTPELIDVSGDSYRFIVYRKGENFGEYSLDPKSNLSDSSASVYEYGCGTTTKLFDIYTAPVTNPKQISFTKRTDGTYMFSACWRSGGSGGELTLGTVVGLYGSSGAFIGEYRMLPSADNATINLSGTVVAGDISGEPVYNAANTYYATLPNVAAPTFIPAPGTYTGTQSVSITCATTGATIRYTTDGSEPTEMSTQYTAPIAVSTNKTVKARAFKTATLPSLRSDAAYVIKLQRKGK